MFIFFVEISLCILHLIKLIIINYFFFRKMTHNSYFRQFIPAFFFKSVSVFAIRVDHGVTVKKDIGPTQETTLFGWRLKYKSFDL